VPLRGVCLVVDEERHKCRGDEEHDAFDKLGAGYDELGVLPTTSQGRYWPLPIRPLTPPPSPRYKGATLVESAAIEAEDCVDPAEKGDSYPRVFEWGECEVDVDSCWGQHGDRVEDPHLSALLHAA